MRIFFYIFICSAISIFDTLHCMNKDDYAIKSMSAFLNPVALKRNMKTVVKDMYQYTKTMALFSLPLVTNAYANSSVPEPAPYFNTASSSSTMPFTFIAVGGVLCCCFVCCGILTKANNEEREKKKLFAQNANLASVIVENVKDDTEIVLQRPSTYSMYNNVETYSPISLSDDDSG